MSVYIPNGIDLADLRRRLDDMQLAGLDLITIEKWRAMLDAYESIVELRDTLSDATGSLESAIDNLGYEPLDHRIDIAGTLDDLEGETLPNGSIALMPDIRKVIEAAIAKEQKESDDLAAKKAQESIDAFRSVMDDLDAVSTNPDALTRQERRTEAARIEAAKAKAAKAKRTPKVTLNPARPR